LCPGSAYRIALGPRAGQKLLSLRTVATADDYTKPKRTLCADTHAFSLHAAVRHAIAPVLRTVDWTAVEVRADRIRMRQPGMAITANGIAQGYVTDRAAALGRLRQRSGRSRRGTRPGSSAGRRRVARGPQRSAQPARTLLELRLGGDRGGLEALATSAGCGTPFGSDSRIHHLLDPHTGRSANHYLSVSVAARRAIVADGLPTALSILPPAQGLAMLKNYPSVRAYLVDFGGRVSVHSEV